MEKYKIKDLLEDRTYRNIESYLDDGEDGIAKLDYNNPSDLFSAVERFQALADPQYLHIAQTWGVGANGEPSQRLKNLPNYTKEKYINSFALKAPNSSIGILKLPLVTGHMRQDSFVKGQDNDVDLDEVRNLFFNAFNVRIGSVNNSATPLVVKTSAIKKTGMVFKKIGNLVPCLTRKVLKKSQSLKTASEKLNLASTSVGFTTKLFLADKVNNQKLSSADKVVALVNHYSQKANAKLAKKCENTTYALRSNEKGKIVYASQLLTDLYVSLALNLGAENHKQIDNGLRLQLANVLAGIEDKDKKVTQTISMLAEVSTDTILKKLGVDYNQIIENRAEMGITYKTEPTNIHEVMFGKTENAHFYKHGDEVIYEGTSELFDKICAKLEGIDSHFGATPIKEPEPIDKYSPKFTTPSKPITPPPVFDADVTYMENEPAEPSEEPTTEPQDLTSGDDLTALPEPASTTEPDSTPIDDSDLFEDDSKDDSKSESNDFPNILPLDMAKANTTPARSANVDKVYVKKQPKPKDKTSITYPDALPLDMAKANTTPARSANVDKVYVKKQPKPKDKTSITYSDALPLDMAKENTTPARSVNVDKVYIKKQPKPEPTKQEEVEEEINPENISFNKGFVNQFIYDDEETEDENANLLKDPDTKLLPEGQVEENSAIIPIGNTDMVIPEKNTDMVVVEKNTDMVVPEKNTDLVVNDNASQQKPKTTRKKRPKPSIDEIIAKMNEKKAQEPPVELDKTILKRFKAKDGKVFFTDDKENVQEVKNVLLGVNKNHLGILNARVVYYDSTKKKKTTAEKDFKVFVYDAIDKFQNYIDKYDLSVALLTKDGKIVKDVKNISDGFGLLAKPETKTENTSVVSKSKKSRKTDKQVAPSQALNGDITIKVTSSGTVTVEQNGEKVTLNANNNEIKNADFKVLKDGEDEKSL